jgi:hypothetical protein
MISREELRDYLKENLRIEVGRDFDDLSCWVNVKLVLEDKVISEDSFTIPDD